jgi:hypothetical protein
MTVLAHFSWQDARHCAAGDAENLLSAVSTRSEVQC